MAAPRLVGAGRAYELMLTGGRFDAAEAERMAGLTAAVEPGELQSTALAKAAEIQLNPPLSVELTKQGMWLALEMPSFDAAVEFENRQQVITALTTTAWRPRARSPPGDRRYTATEDAQPGRT